MTASSSRWAWLAAIREPQQALEWSLADWERVIRLARRLRLLARLAEALDAAGHLASVPAPAARHLRAEQCASRARTTATTWAARRVAAALAQEPYPCVLLKGGAYLGQGLSIAAGRLPSDLDILVPRAHLDAAQARLKLAGWEELEVDDYTRQYYREWSHEVPPMQHPVHPIELDLHHHILPPLRGLHVPAEALLQQLRPSRWPVWKVLHPVDQVLHSAAHLFFDPEPSERVRDLVDLDGLMRHFGQSEAGFWQQLAPRAAALGLAEPLALASHFCVTWLGTPIPDDARRAIESQGPHGLRRAGLIALFAAVLTPTEPDAPSPWSQRIATRLVAARYHRKRMSLRTLLPHLMYKWHTRRDAAPPVSDAASAAPR